MGGGTYFHRIARLACFARKGFSNEYTVLSGCYCQRNGRCQASFKTSKSLSTTALLRNGSQAVHCRSLVQFPSGRAGNGRFERRGVLQPELRRGTVYSIR